ncbi:hypothetical protein D9758_018387 [Tetrapyrgos nigripes]|uniref:Alcohol dehydrogenase-like C-terminal domain-containing protein n=1 Tax=Tetrapyrgos nigripes TaxID=182062 RepID=A0A8H5BT74_9AGAR|nr:hypothetical protein D9758_018387 [Tetrapyrgos nigripes]
MLSTFTACANCWGNPTLYFIGIECLCLRLRRRVLSLELNGDKTYSVGTWCYFNGGGVRIHRIMDAPFFDMLGRARSACQPLLRTLHQHREVLGGSAHFLTSCIKVDQSCSAISYTTLPTSRSSNDMTHTHTLPKTQTAALYRPGDISLSVVHDYPVPKPGKEKLCSRLLLLESATPIPCFSLALPWTPELMWSGMKFVGRLLSKSLSSFFILKNQQFSPGFMSSTVLLLLFRQRRFGSDVDKSKIHTDQLYIVLIFDHHDHGINGGPALLNSTGVGIDGGYEEYVKVREDQLVQAPSGIPPEVAAIAADAGITAYDAVANKAGLGIPGYWQKPKVLIFGIGGLGHLAVQYAKHFGATVYACDYKPEARKLALELGATEAFDLIELTNRISQERFTVDITVDFVGQNETFKLCLNALRGNDIAFPVKSTAVIVGISTETFTVSVADLLTTGVNVVTTQYGSRKDAEAALELFANGTVKPVVSTVPLGEVNKVIDELRASKVRGRKVVIPGHDHV